ncbi:MAG: N-6 DNA methylase, partial [Candidatus Methanoperedens sp.]|nr:N-6 DNA methylase [Candidatus Methanoperedens sp.]
KERKGDCLTMDERKRLMNSLVGYDISPDMVRLSLVNMYLHGFQTPKIYEYDTLTSEEKWNETYDVILANPPFMTPKGGIRPHKRFSVQANRSEVLFVDYIMEHLTINGRAGVIVPEGIIFQSANAYKALRKLLVDTHLFAVVSLPQGVFQPYSGVKTCILLMDKSLAKRAQDILFVKIENEGFDLGAQRRAIDKNNLPGALEILLKYKRSLQEGKECEFSEEEGRLAHRVARVRIAEGGDYNLSGERYKEVAARAKGGWEMVELGVVAEVFIDGDWVESKDQSDTGIRLIQTGNVGFGEYLDKGDKARFITDEKFKELNCTEVFEGDVLISRLPDPVGRACLVPKLNTRMITAVDCTIVRFNPNKLMPKLFVYFTKTDNYYKNIFQYLTGASRQRISRSNLYKIKIPLPPLSVQQEIVAEIEGYQKVVDGARQVVENYKPMIKVDEGWEVVELGDACEIATGKLDANAAERD